MQLIDVDTRSITIYQNKVTGKIGSREGCAWGVGGGGGGLGGGGEEELFAFCGT